MTRLLPIAAAALIGLGPAPQAPPQLVAPRSLSVVSGRGEATLFATDAKGERIAEDPGRKPNQFRFKETTRPLRWAVVVGTVDFRSIRRAFPDVPAGAPPAWPGKRIDLERQQRLAGGGWTDWAPVDTDANLDILDNLTEAEAERVLPQARPEAFVDPLPFLKSGEWQGVDVEAFVDKRLDDARVRGLRRRQMPALPLGPAAPAVVADEVMIRSIDFTVRPGSAYRYRARVVAVDPGPRRNGDEVSGPWSGPTGEVAIPRD